ncbi:MAG: hypothetical protein D6776_03490, partial [Planctomycetota bacterium]
MLDRWPDGSIRWALLDWQFGADSGDAPYRLRVGPTTEPRPVPHNPVRVERKDESLRLAAGPIAITLQ